MKTFITTVVLTCTLVPAFAQIDSSSKSSPGAVTVTNGASLVPVIELKAIPEEPPVLSPPPVVSASNVVATATEHPLKAAVPRSIEVVPGGAHAGWGLHAVDFKTDISEPINITTPDGQVLSFAPAFLALWDSVSGQTLLLAQVTNANAVATLFLPDTIIYSNVLDTLNADLRYRYNGTANSLEQDLILHEAPQNLPPGFAPENIRLQVWTAWFHSTPVASKPTAITLRDKSTAAEGVTMDDATIDFDTMKIVVGSAFDLSSLEEKVPVAKSWFPSDQPGVSWLVESIDYVSIKQSLDQLKQVEMSFSANDAHNDRHSLLGCIPHRPSMASELKPMLVTRNATPVSSGVVLDFVIISSVPTPAGIVAWWPAGGDTSDVISNDNGALYNGAGYAAGEVGQAFSLTSSPSRFVAPDAPSLYTPTAMSLETWVYINSYPGNDSVLLAGKDDSNLHEYQLALWNAPGYWCFRAMIQLSGTIYYITGSTVPQTNQWYHVAMTYDGSALRLFVNGNSVQAYTNAGPITTLSCPLFIGGYDSGPWTLNGRVDETSIYNRALSLTEIQSIYNAGGAGKRNPRCVAPSTNAIGWWPGDGNENDLARTNFASLFSDATYASARVGQGFSFNGTSSYVEIPNAPDLNPTNAVTLEAWVYQTGNLNQNQPIISKDNLYQRQYFLTVSDQGKFRAHVGTPSGVYYFDGTNSVALNTWYHVAMTYDGSALKLYVNGAIDTSSNAPGTIITGPDVVKIGGSYSGGWGTYKFAGLIDEATVYNRALSANEISTIYSAGGAGKCKVDTDGDGLTDLQESFVGTNPNAVDSDADGVTDGDAVFVSHISPLNPWLVVWGTYTNNPVVSAPTYLGYVSQAVGGSDFTVALLTNGTVKAWGNQFIETNLPANLNNTAAIAANASHALALRADGSVTNWGAWFYHATNYAATVPTGLGNVIGIAAGQNHDVALKSDGTIVVWGYTNTAWNTTPSGLTGVKAVAAGYQHTVALLSNGTVTAWGLNFQPDGWYITNVPPGLSNVTAIAAGEYHTLALKSDGTVVAWGAGTNIAPNDIGTLFAYGQSIVPPGLTNVIAIAAGGHNSIALRSDGSVVSWGLLGAAPQGLTHVSAIGAGDGHLLAERPGWETPLIYPAPTNQCICSSCSSAWFTNVAVGLSPTPSVSYQWRQNGTNLAGASTNVYVTNNAGNYDVVVTSGAGSTTNQNVSLNYLNSGPQIASITPASGQLVALVGDTNNVSITVVATNAFPCPCPIYYTWSFNGRQSPPDTNGSRKLAIVRQLDNGVVTVGITNAGGGTNLTFKVVAVGPGSGVSWGNMAQPWDYVPDVTNAVKLAAGGNHALAVLDDGRIVAWGTNTFGQTNAPSGITSAISVAAGDAHSLLLKADGTVIAWGRNDSNIQQTNVPSIATNVMAISAGGQQSLALRKDRTLVQWGLTNGAIPSSTLGTTMAIASGTNFNVALLTNGNVVAWGNNASGQTSVPSSANGVVAIAAGGMHALALRTNGVVVAWGSNGSGESSVPSTLNNIMAIAAGYSYSLAVSNNGTMTGWGDNSYSQLNVPSPINSSYAVKFIAAGGYRTYASLFSTFIQYPVDVTKDLLLVYNSSSTSSTFVANYYLTNRPMVAGARILPVACASSESISITDFNNQIVSQLSSWLNLNPTLRPAYIVTFIDVPQVVTGGSGVSYFITTNYIGWQPFVHSINFSNVSDCVGYINRLTNYPGQLFISASAANYGNTNYYFDGVNAVANDPQALAAAEAVMSNGVPASAVTYVTSPAPHISRGTNVAGYWTYGTDGLMSGIYSLDNSVVFQGNNWYIMGSVDSFNGSRGTLQCYFLLWFRPTSFGGMNYSSIPIGAVSHVFEPGITHIENTAMYFGLWSAGKPFAICAWSSRFFDLTPYFQVTGDPFVKQ